MSEHLKDTKSQELAQLERIKRLAVASMFSEDVFMDKLVLKGGNAMALIHRLASRESVDLDFSMHDDFDEDPEQIRLRIEQALQRTFRPEGFEPFDVKLAEKPAKLSEDVASFWGGYTVEFKLANTAEYEEWKDDLNKLRRSAVSIGQGKKFLIDISRFEYVEDKEEFDLDGYTIYVYTPLMIACEKLRAICQQMNEYGPVIHRGRPATERARDFFDIHTLVEKTGLDLLSPRAIDMVREMFLAKRVEVAWLGQIEAYREQHRAGWPAVQATVASNAGLQNFDFYFNYVVEHAQQVMVLAMKAPEVV